MSLRQTTVMGFHAAAGAEAPTQKIRHQNEKLKQHMKTMDQMKLDFELGRIDRELDNRESDKAHLDRAKAHAARKLQRVQSWNNRWAARDVQSRSFREKFQGQRLERFETSNSNKAKQLKHFEERKQKIFVEYPAEMLHEREVIANLQGNAVLDLVNAYRREKLHTA